MPPPKILYAIGPDFVARILGGYSRLVLAKWEGRAYT